MNSISKIEGEESKHTGEITEQGSTGTLRDVVGDVEDPKADYEDSYGSRSVGGGVAKDPADVSGVGDDDDGDHDGDSADEDEGAAAAEAAGAAVAHVADERLDEEAGDRAAEPDDAGPLVRDAKLLDVGSEEGELQGPTELNTARH